MGQIFKNAKKILLEDVDSTNVYAGTLSPETPEGTTVVARFQSLGRGHGNSKWESTKGLNLTFSVVLHPVFLKITDQFYLSKAISLAVADFVALYCTGVTIKWPNDIYIGNKKVAGILIENAVERDFIKNSIIGIGINVNQLEFDSDAPNPVSLSQVTGEIYNLDELLDIFLDILEYRYQLLMENERDILNENYAGNLFQKATKANYVADGNTFAGTIVGVEETGELIVQDENGNIRKFLHKEVAFLLPNN